MGGGCWTEINRHATRDEATAAAASSRPSGDPLHQMFASPRGCGVYTVEAGSGAIRCVEVKPKVGATQC